MKTLWLLGNQLSMSLSGFRHIHKERDRILLIESRSRATWLPYHQQKLVLVYSAMRHFRDELRSYGYHVDYVRTETFEEGLASHIEQMGTQELIVHLPTDWTMRRLIEKWAQRSNNESTQLTLLEEDDLFLVRRDEWPQLLGKHPWKMERVYRKLRLSLDVLMEAGEPVGGRWNYDAENRSKAQPGRQFVPARSFPPDAMTQEVMDFVKMEYAHHPGKTESFAWPVTREQALEVLDHFIIHRLADFGEQQDAMLVGEPFMSHSLLSGAINLGLLQPMEVIRRAEQAYRDGVAPIEAVEGFVRQILGWREYIRGVYICAGPDYSKSNVFRYERPLPAFYWGEETRMNCLRTVVKEVIDNGYSHHIQRLMVLGNFALLAGIRPQEVVDWFEAMYVDAYEWVVTPNVIGMAIHADGGLMATKPYVASANYMKRMSNYCQGCAYSPDQRVGENACPFNSLYWSFIDRHYDMLRANPRMQMICASWSKMPEQDKNAILKRAEEVLRHSL